jgi:hypothetical protein
MSLPERQTCYLQLWRKDESSKYEIWYEDSFWIHTHICTHNEHITWLGVSQYTKYSRYFPSLKETYRVADKSLAWPGRKQANVSVRMAWISFGALPFWGGGGNLMTARVSVLLKSRASLTCFRACFLPGRAKDLSAPQYVIHPQGKSDLPWKCKRSSVRITTVTDFYETARHHIPSHDTVRYSWISVADKTVRNTRIRFQSKTPICANNLRNKSNKHVK